MALWCLTAVSYTHLDVYKRQGYTIKETAEIIKTLTGFKGELVFDTNKIDGAPNKIMAAERCEEVFGWKPSTDYVQGLERSIESYKAVSYTHLDVYKRQVQEIP